MTDKNELRKLKNETREKLRGIELRSYHLDRIDVRLNTYIESVISDTAGHNLYELLSIVRFFRLMETCLFKIG